MEATILIGLQAAGKSTFYLKRFFRSHVRINLDMLKTRHRERIIFEACLAAKQPFVVDNTNLTTEDRQRYISAAKAAGFRVIGYYLQSKIEACLARNAGRSQQERIPDVALRGAAGRLAWPSMSEGFDELFYVSIADNDTFSIQEWRDEV